MGICEFKLGSYDKAILNFDKCLQIKPADSEAHLLKSKCIKKLIHYAESLYVHDKNWSNKLRNKSDKQFNMFTYWKR